eukprot:Transcript_24293.p1 GENE.Transcript_24293~~Transcript_24293.p1  ORF type:complete len:569 (-),score=168.97 Transcript_24293:72-1679(-)
MRTADENDGTSAVVRPSACSPFCGGSCDRVSRSVPAVTAFFNGFMTYVLSKNWFDMMAIYVPRVLGRPVIWVELPYCDAPERPPDVECEDPEPWWTQLMLALLLLAAAVPLVSFFNKLARTRPAFVDIDPMVGMMVGWSLGYACKRSITGGEDEVDVCGGDATCMVCVRFLFAMSATLLVAVLFIFLRPRLLRAGKGASPDSALSGAALQRTTRAGPTPASQLRRCSRAGLLELRISLCALGEGTLGWTTGCSWTKAVSSFWPPFIETKSIDAYPSMRVLLCDFLAAIFVTLLAVGWLLYLADDPLKYDDVAKSRRSAVEQYFATNAMAYFVGWCHITYLRDLVTLTREGLIEAGARDELAQLGELAVVFLFGPVLTLLMIQAKALLLRRYAALATRRAPSSPRRPVLAHDMLPPLLRPPAAAQREGFWPPFTAQLAAEHAPTDAAAPRSRSTRMGAGPIEQVNLITDAVRGPSAAPPPAPMLLFAPIVCATPLRELWPEEPPPEPAPQYDAPHDALPTPVRGGSIQLHEEAAGS